MSARLRGLSARIEIVHVGPYQFHARVVAANNEIVWTTESYRTRRSAVEAAYFLQASVPSASVMAADDRRAPRPPAGAPATPADEGAQA